MGLEEELVKGISKAYSVRERGDYGVIPSVSEEDLDLMEGDNKGAAEDCGR
ncbi:MAG: hypothetical protein QI197_06745 [Candidatus Korarchaeota archaeon]|nr:hypothetical protein [Candidatus Korarchaeota archaeon]